MAKNAIGMAMACEEYGAKFFANGAAPSGVLEKMCIRDRPTGERRGGLHAGQLKSYIQLCLALSQMAKMVKTASPKPQQNENPKYAMRTWLLRLGFIGDEMCIRDSCRSYIRNAKECWRSWRKMKMKMKLPKEEIVACIRKQL